MAQQPQQQVIPADQLVTKYQRIGRCNHFSMLQNIPCSEEYKIVGILLVDHSLSHALTSTVDVPVVYLQQFWKIVNKVPNTKDTIRFTINRETIMYTVDMLRDALKLPVETLENSLIVPADLKYIPRFLRIVGYEGIVDKKDSIQYPRFTKLIIADLMKKFPSIAPRLEEDYHSIKDDVPLGNVYTIRNVMVRGLLIPSDLLTDEIRASKEYTAYEEKFVRKPSTTSTPPPGDDKERDDIAEASILSLTLHKIALAAEAQENVAKVQDKIIKEDIDKFFDDEEDNSYASAFSDLEKKDDGKDDDDKDVDDDDHVDHALVRKKVSGSSEIRNEKMQTPILSPPRSPGKDFS
ncbi:hypothetical protein Tco_0713345 [Tanacetum coccineum]